MADAGACVDMCQPANMVISGNGQSIACGHISGQTDQYRYMYPQQM